MDALNNLANQQQIKANAFNEMCQSILDEYNKLSGKKYMLPEIKDYYGKDSQDQNPLFRLFAKLHHMAFDIYSPDSIPSFLKRIVTKGVKMQSMPSQVKNDSEHEQYGLGHFRWDWKAYTLNENELKAIAIYLNIDTSVKTVKLTNKEKYELSKGINPAQAFLELTETKLTASFKEHDFYFSDDKETRDIYNIVLKNKQHRFRFTFGQSISNQGTPPTPYDVLACLTKYDVGTFNDFCSEFGYDADSRKAYKIYKNVLREWKNVELLWDEKQLELLKEIN